MTFIGITIISIGLGKPFVEISGQLGCSIFWGSIVLHNIVNIVGGFATAFLRFVCIRRNDLILKPFYVKKLMVRILITEGILVLFMVSINGLGVSVAGMSLLAVNTFGYFLALWGTFLHFCVLLCTFVYFCVLLCTFVYFYVLLCTFV